MQYYVIFTLLCTAAWAQIQPDSYSYSRPMGRDNGSPYTLSGSGKITAVRMWEHNSNYMTGLQVRFGNTWTPVVGYRVGIQQEFELFEGETIVQVSGKYGYYYIQTIVFTTSRGRTLSAGQPSGKSYHLYPSHSQAELRILSGRVNGVLSSIGAHWAVA